MDRQEVDVCKRFVHLFTHLWKTFLDTGPNIYEECGMCGFRRVRHRSGGYQPVDEYWLMGVGEKPCTKRDHGPPPQGGSVLLPPPPKTQKRCHYEVKIIPLDDNTYGVRFSIDHQSFDLDVHGPSDEAQWYARQLLKALDRLGQCQEVV